MQAFTKLLQNVFVAVSVLVVASSATVAAATEIQVEFDSTLDIVSDGAGFSGESVIVEGQDTEADQHASADVLDEEPAVVTGSNVDAGNEDSIEFTTSFESASLVDTDELEENRGTSNPFSASYFFANSSGNSANNTVSGENRISDSAFSNATGIATSIQNTGNNVVIQSSTIVNVDFQ